MEAPFKSLSMFPDSSTPAFVYDFAEIKRLMKVVFRMQHETSAQVLYSLKSLAFVPVLEKMRGYVDGFAVSSLFEAKLARSVLGDRGSVHITTPGIRPDEIGALTSVCDYVSFNSLGQLKRYRDTVESGASYGLRVNPQVSFVEDERYDPCRIHSKLGVPLEHLVKLAADESDCLLGLKGLHLHSNCDTGDLDQPSDPFASSSDCSATVRSSAGPVSSISGTAKSQSHSARHPAGLPDGWTVICTA